MCCAAKAVDSADRSCPRWSAPVAAGTIGTGSLDEASGLAASARDAGVLWTHNDDGDGVLFGLSSEGAVLGTLQLSGVDPVDWESVATSTARGLPEIIVGDIGDNDALRESIALWVTAEPETVSGALQSSLVERVTVTLPDRPMDAEAMVVDPATGRLLLFTRGSDRSLVYAVDWSGGGQTVAEQVTELDLNAPPFDSLGAIRAADVAPDGSVVLRLTRGAVWFPGSGSALDALASAACPVPAPEEADGEGVAMAGTDLYFVGEGIEPTLWVVAGSRS